MPVSEEGATFIFTAGNTPVTLEGEIVMTIPLLDKTEKVYSSEQFALRVGREYLSVDLQDATGHPITVIDPDNPQATLSVRRITQNAPAGIPQNNFQITILDDISGKYLVENASASQGKFPLPDEITGTIGTYRAIVKSQDGVAGEVTFSVMPGGVTQAKIIGASNSLILGSTTLMTLSLEDARGSAASTDLHSAVIRVR